MHRWLALFAYIAVTTTGCGGDDDPAAADAAPATDDAAPAGPDAAPPDAGVLNPADCPATYGRAGVAATFVVAGEGVGFDLDGDDQIDNALAGIGALLNNGFAQDIAAGTMLVLSELRGLDDATLMADAALDVVIYGGVDADDPANPDDNLSGSEPLYYTTDWVEAADCAPKFLAPATLAGGVITAESDYVSFYVESLGGFLEIERAHLDSPVEPGASTGFQSPDGQPTVFGGAIKQCTLATAPADLGASAQHALCLVGIQPDIDLDGDGLETIQYDSTGILSCTDGDGTTVIDGETCGCDPRMADGYSVAFQLTLVGAEVLGPQPD